MPLSVAMSKLSGNDAQEEDFLPRVHYLLMTAELEKRFVHMPRGLVKQILSSHSRLQDNLETAHAAISDLQCELHYRDQEETEARKAIRTTAIKLTRPRKAMKAMKAMKFMKPMKGKKATKPMKATKAKRA